MRICWRSSRRSSAALARIGRINSSAFLRARLRDLSSKRALSLLWPHQEACEGAPGEPAEKKRTLNEAIHRLQCCQSHDCGNSGLRSSTMAIHSSAKNTLSRPRAPWPLGRCADIQFSLAETKLSGNFLPPEFSEPASAASHIDSLGRLPNRFMLRCDAWPVASSCNCLRPIPRKRGTSDSLIMGLWRGKQR
jgi:hypothetical protein